jgi:hypothetical protein
MNDCVLKIYFNNNQHLFKNRLLRKPDNGKFSISVRVPLCEKGTKLIGKFSPMFHWQRDVFRYINDHSVERKRPVCDDLRKQVILEQGVHRWSLDGVVPTGVDSNNNWKDETIIIFTFAYENCTRLIVS